MLYNLFFVCALAGGAVAVLHFLVSLLGLGLGHVDIGGHLDMDVPDHVDLPGHVDLDHAHAAPDHGSTWFFGIVSIRTVVAAIAFFGLAGLAASEAGLPESQSFALALVGGAAAMYGVYYAMETLVRLRHDGTQRMENAVGRRGTVYLPIPASQGGAGKVQLELQGRIVECRAVTSAAEPLKVGETVEVVSVLGASGVDVKPVSVSTRSGGEDALA